MLLGIGIFGVVVMASAACGMAPRESRWKVDIVNGAQRLQVSITTERAGYAWIVPPGARMVLLDEPAAPAGGTIELVDVGGTCKLYDSADVLTTSFTIVVDAVPGQAQDFELRLIEGASIPGPKNENFEAACSG